jgi:hypothetical protein
MKLFRKTWIIVTNGAAVYLLYRSFSQIALLNSLLEQESRNKTRWFGFSLRAFIPAIGILLELLGSRFAKWVNIGYFFFAGVVLSAVGMLARPDHHAWIYLFLGCPRWLLPD